MTGDLPDRPPAGASSLSLILRSLLFATVLWASLPLFAPLTLLLLPFPFPLRYRFASQWARFGLWWLETTCRLHYRVEGREHIPDRPAIAMSKHQSAWETLALQMFFVPQVWVLKRELLWVPFFGWGLATLRPIAIDRKAGRRAVDQVVALGRQRLEDGCWVVIFPEGTRVPAGHRRRYRMGGAVLAAHTGYPVVPVAHNAGEFWPRRAFVKHPGTIQLVIGPPIKTLGRSAAEINADVEGWIEGTMDRISRSD